MPDFYSSWSVTGPSGIKHLPLTISFSKQYCRDVCYHEMTRGICVFPMLSTSSIYDTWGVDILYYARWHWVRNRAPLLQFRNEIGHAASSTVMERSREYWTPMIIAELSQRFPMLQFSQGERVVFSGNIPTIICEGDYNVPVAFYWAVYLQRLITQSQMNSVEYTADDLISTRGDTWHKAAWIKLVKGEAPDASMNLIHNTGPIGISNTLRVLTEQGYNRLIQQREDGRFSEELETLFKQGDAI